MGKKSETSAGHPSFLPPLLFFLSFLLSVRLLCMGWRRRRRRSTLFYPFYLKQRFSVTARRENGDEEVESEGRRPL